MRFDRPTVAAVQRALRRKRISADRRFRRRGPLRDRRSWSRLAARRRLPESGEQRQNQRGRRVYSLHAPEVECIGKGRPRRPYEFGGKVSAAKTLHRQTGGQFIAHVKALPAALTTSIRRRSSCRRSRRRSARASRAPAARGRYDARVARVQSPSDRRLAARATFSGRRVSRLRGGISRRPPRLSPGRFASTRAPPRRPEASHRRTARPVPAGRMQRRRSASAS